MSTDPSLAQTLRRFSIVAALAGVAHAQQFDWSARVASFVQPEAEADALAVDDFQGDLPIEFGLEGGRWLTFGGGAATDFVDAQDAYGYIQYSRFLADDFEWAVELGGWALDEPSDYAPGVSASSFFRWHFYRDETWTTFADIGMGVLLAGDKVPEGGTNFNFLPRVGVGATYRLGESNARLIGGVRWHHISNARILGNDSNPGRDSAMFYLGVSIPF